MIRKTEVRLIVIASALAIFILPASAQATTFTTSAASGTLAGTQTTEQVITTGAGTVRCTTFNQATSFSSNSFNTVDFIPAYSGCKAFGGLPATVSTGKCTYEYTGAGQTGGKTLFDIVCSSGEMTVTTATCTVHIPAQTGLGHVGFSNGAGDINEEFTVTGLKYEQTAGCPNGAGVKTDGTITGGSTIKASTGTIQVD